MINRKSGVLLLSHCGFSFMEDLVEVVNKIGMESYMLSSYPTSNAEERINQLNSLTPNVSVTSEYSLSWADVKSEIDRLRTNGIKIVACLSVWEGYRDLMTLANGIVGGKDICRTDVATLRDKYILRKKLLEAGLSNISVELLSKSNFTKFKDSNTKYFVKPRFGIASYGAFSLSEEDSWEKIESIQNEFKQDREYRSIFSESSDFIVEDYIQGNEYSFEIIVSQEKIYIIGIHEKIDLQETNSTVLEAACLSAPTTLSRIDIEKATHWIEEIFNGLSIQHGCYHVEAKCYQKNWEIIEINPRVGGAFITKSVEILTDGCNLLSLWLKTLVSKTKGEFHYLHELLEKISTKHNDFYLRKHKTFSRVFFAKKNGVIKNIRINELFKKADVCKIFLRKGSLINNQSREVFAGQAVWKINESETLCLNDLIDQSNQFMEIEYE